jgi:hypothetical protein
MKYKYPAGAVEKVKYFQIFPLCPFVQNFVILCGLMFWILPQRDTKVITKVHKGLFKHPQSGGEYIQTKTMPLRTGCHANLNDID